MGTAGAAMACRRIRRGCSSAWFRAPACHAGGRGFESRHSRHIPGRAASVAPGREELQRGAVLMQASDSGAVEGGRGANAVWVPGVACQAYRDGWREVTDDRVDRTPPRISAHRHLSRHCRRDGHRCHRWLYVLAPQRPIVTRLPPMSAASTPSKMPAAALTSASILWRSSSSSSISRSPFSSPGRLVQRDRAVRVLVDDRLPRTAHDRLRLRMKKGALEWSRDHDRRPAG